MANSTKKALEASLKKLLKEKPFDKITICLLYTSPSPRDCS